MRDPLDLLKLLLHRVEALAVGSQIGGFAGVGLLLECLPGLLFRTELVLQFLEFLLELVTAGETGDLLTLDHVGDEGLGHGVDDLLEFVGPLPPQADTDQVRLFRRRHVERCDEPRHRVGFLVPNRLEVRDVGLPQHRDEDDGAFEPFNEVLAG